MDRRNMMVGSAAAALAGRATRLWAADSPSSKALNALFDKFMQEGLDLSPLSVTELGLDTGARAHQKSEVDDGSLAGVAKQKKITASQLSRLQAFDRNSLSRADSFSYDVVMYGLRTGDASNKAFAYGPAEAGRPYVLSQFDGSYLELPSFLDSGHTIQNNADCDAYLARLNGFATLLDQEIEVARHDVALGVIPPDFVLVAALEQMRQLRTAAPEKSSLTESVARRAREQHIAGDYARSAAQLVRDKVYPALDGQLALLQDMQKRASHDAGVWKL